MDSHRTPTRRMHAPAARRSLVLDTRPLGRQPGAVWSGHRTVPAPVGLRLDLVEVPEGSELGLDITLESVSDGVLVTAVVNGTTEGECARCLDPVVGTVRVTVQELYAYPDPDARRGRREHVPDDDDEDEVRRLDGDFLDLEQPLRDAIVLELPHSPHCSEDCPGLCPECGTRLAEAGPGHVHERQDPRGNDPRGDKEE